MKYDAQKITACRLKAASRDLFRSCMLFIYAGDIPNSSMQLLEPYDLSALDHGIDLFSRLDLSP